MEETSLKKLSYKLFFFLSPLVVLIVILSVFEVDNPKKYSVPKTIKTVFVGDSHINFAIGPTAHYANYGVNSQSIRFSYQLVRRLITSNDHLSTIVIGLAPHNILDDSNRFTEKNYAQYFDLFSNDEKIALFTQGTITNYLLFFREYIKEKFNNNLYGYDIQQYKQPILSKETVLGGQTIKQRISFQYYKDNMLKMKTTRDSLYYFRLKSLLDSKNIQLHFMNTPTYTDYRDKIPKRIMNKFKDFITKNQLPYLDLSRYQALERAPENFIQDGDHLSFYGASTFTKCLIDDNLFQ